MKEGERVHGGMKTGPAHESSLPKVDIDDAISGCRGFSDIELANLNQQSQTLHQKANQCMIEEDAMGELHYLKEAITLYTRFGNDADGKWLSPFYNQLYSLRCAYLSALLANGRIDEAIVQCEHIVSFLAVAFSSVQNHPLLGLQLFTLGDLNSGMAMNTKARYCYTWARKVMLVSHGASDPMVQVLDEHLS